MVFRKKRNFKKRSRPGYKAMRSRYNRRRRFRGRSDKLRWKPIQNNPMPQEYITKVRLRAQGYFPSGVGVPPVGFNSTGNYVNNLFWMNNLYQPLSLLQTAGVNQINGLNWQTDPNLQPIGHQTLCNSTTYRSYQVLATKFKFTMLPAIGGDRMQVVVCPNPLGAGLGAPATITDTLAVPWAHMVFTNQGEKTKTAQVYVDIAKYLGVDKKIFRNDLNGQWSGTYNSAPTALPTISVVAQLCEHNAPGAPVGFIIEQDFYVRYYNLANNLLL